MISPSSASVSPPRPPPASSIASIAPSQRRETDQSTAEQQSGRGLGDDREEALGVAGGVDAVAGVAQSVVADVGNGDQSLPIAQVDSHVLEDRVEWLHTQVLPPDERLFAGVSDAAPADDPAVAGDHLCTAREGAAREIAESDHPGVGRPEEGFQASSRPPPTCNAPAVERDVQRRAVLRAAGQITQELKATGDVPSERLIGREFVDCLPLADDDGAVAEDPPRRSGRCRMPAAQTW